MFSPKEISSLFGKNWELRVSTSLKVASIERKKENKGERRINSVNRDGQRDEGEERFNLGLSPPFKLASFYSDKKKKKKNT